MAKKGLSNSLALAACLAVLPAMAAGLEIDAQLDQTTVDINGSLTLTVTVSGDTASIPEPQLPELSSFNVYSSGRRQDMSIINGKVSSSIVFNYVLSPRYIGKHTIPAISVFNGREKLFTREMEVEVTKGAAQPQTQPGQPGAGQRRSGRAAGRQQKDDAEPIFIRAETDRRSAYINEQINLTIKFYTSVPLTSNPQYLPPALRNLMAEDLPPVRSGETVINGTRYYFNEIKTALFGLGAGKASIETAKILAQVQRAGALDAFAPGFFQQFFSMNMAQGEPVELVTKPLTLEILDFPPDAPAGFSGAVGNYIVSASADRRELKAGEALTLSVTVSGKGNLKGITAPKLPDLPGFKVYDTMSSLDVTKNSDNLGGRKTFTTVLVPKAEGVQTVPPVKLVFFNPDLKTYQQTESQPLEIKVLKGDARAASINFGSSNGQTGVNKLETDIAYIREKAAAPASERAARGLLSLSWLNLLPVFILLGSLAFSRSESLRLSNPLLFKFRKAGRKALDRLREARRIAAGGDFKAGSALIHDIFLDYLSDKSGVNIGALTMKKAAEALKARFPAAHEAPIERIKGLWEQLEFYRYAPAELDAGKAKDLADTFETLLETLEEEFKK